MSNWLFFGWFVVGWAIFTWTNWATEKALGRATFAEAGCLLTIAAILCWPLILCVYAYAWWKVKAERKKKAGR
jgi:hypothetical protein